jgi:hypothetical protein
MSLTFAKEFKKAILSGDKVATIRNTKHYNVGTIFTLNLGTRFKPESIGKARCIAVIEIKVAEFISYLGCASSLDTYFEVDLLSNLPMQLSYKKIGFKNCEEAFDFYKNYLKNEYCYLHIFEVVKE